MSNIPILDERREKAIARDLARSFVPLVVAPFHAHNQCRRDVMDQIKMEVERGAAADPPHGGNALYLAIKELELAIHSQTMSASVNTLAILAALGVEVPIPADELPAEGEVTN